MEDVYSDVDSTVTDADSATVVTSNLMDEGSSRKSNSNVSEIYELIVTAEMCELLDKSKSELAEIVRRIEVDMGVTKKSVLLAIPEAVRIRYGIPARLNLVLTSLARKSQPRQANSTGSPSSKDDFSTTLYVDGLNHGLRNDELNVLTDLVVNRHKINSLYTLQQITAEDVEFMLKHKPDQHCSLTPGVIYYLRKHFLKMKDGRYFQPALTVLQILTFLTQGDVQVIKQNSGRIQNAVKSPRPSRSMAHDSASLGSEWIYSTATKLADRYNLRYVEQINDSLELKDLKQIVESENLPYATFLLLRRFCKSEELTEIRARADQSAFTLSGPGEVFEEPTVQELIMRVGSHFGHPAAEIEQYVDVLVKQNWLTTLDHLRVVNKNYLLQLNLSPTFIQNLLDSLKNPEVLNMTLAEYAESSVDDRIKIREAIECLYKEIADDNQKFEVFHSFVRLFQHLILTPHDACKRLVRKDNPIFRKSEPFKATSSLLEALGYVEYDDCFLLPVLHMSRTQYAHELLASHCAELRKEEMAPSSAAENIPENLTKYMTSAWIMMRDQITSAVVPSPSRPL